LNPTFVGSVVLVSAGGAGWSAGALVAVGCVEGELAEQFAGGCVDDADVQVLDWDEDVGSGVGSADADGVEPAAVAQGDLAAGVDAVAADSVVGVVGAVPPTNGNTCTRSSCRADTVRSSLRVSLSCWTS
jgi:hypothetical protein